MSIGIYIHIPFCVSKCAYCDFYSLACGKNGANGKWTEQKNAYTAALCRQISLWGEKYGHCEISSVFIGGGTPTTLSSGQLTAISDSLKSAFHLTPDAEFTVEANPMTFDKEKLAALKKAGVNRLSIGMQSADDNELKLLSRIHSQSGLEQSFNTARESGFDNINLDIMYGIPSQTVSSFRKTLDAVLSLAPEHISVYGLQLESGTRLYQNREKYSFPGEDEETEMNALAQNVLEKAGYCRYEISNYSLPGRECRHNLLYWNAREYLGFGAGACSYFDRKRFRISPDIESYCQSSDFSEITETEEILSDEDAAREYIMLRMRLCEGLEIKKLQDLTPNTEKYLLRAGKFIKPGLIKEKDGFLSFTPAGFNVSNTILSEIIYSDD